jgi:hypothetical protein
MLNLLIFINDLDTRAFFDNFKDYQTDNLSTFISSCAKHKFFAAKVPLYPADSWAENLGFKTFDGIIDESYDNVEDNQTRWTMALSQLMWLDTQDQIEILEEASSILEHNYNLLQQNFYSKLVTDVTTHSNNMLHL